MPRQKTARERLEAKRRRNRNRRLQEKLTKNTQPDGTNIIQHASMDPDDDDADLTITEDAPHYDL